MTLIRLLPIGALIACTTTLPQPPHPPVVAKLHAPAPASQDPEDPLAKAARLGRPGPEHEALTKLAGTYRVTIEVGMPGSPLLRSKGTATFRMTLGDRYLVEEFQGRIAATPVEALAITGYDQVTAQYNNVWLDTTTTSWLATTGTKTEAGVIEFRGLIRDSATPDGRAYRMVERYDPAGTLVREVYDTVQGRELRVMTMTYAK